jgi:RNA polymerase sigma factor (sigma-70 family)
MENFKEIIKEYHPILYKIGRVYTNDDDFDDLYQEMLIAIWKALKNFRGDSKISTWLYKVALNTALTYQRKNKFSFLQKSNLDEIENIPFTHEN